MSLLLLLNGPRDPRHLELSALARQLREEERSDLAVVAAQSACEVYAEVAVREMLRARELGEFEDVIPDLLPGYNLKDRRGQRVFHALTGTSIQSAKFWSSYMAHVTLRNHVVHRGRQVTAKEATASIEAAEAFHEFVAAAWEAAPQQPSPAPATKAD